MKTTLVSIFLGNFLEIIPLLIIPHTEAYSASPHMTSLCK